MNYPHFHAAPRGSYLPSCPPPLSPCPPHSSSRFSRPIPSPPSLHTCCACVNWVLMGHLPVVQYLVTAGADVNHTTDDGPAPIHAARQEGHVGVVRILEEAGATTL